jgi:predicted ATP-grasp superfamily ATP-dependent carboligase
MRILVYEFVTAGGFESRAVRKSLIREGEAMLGALTADLAQLSDHTIVAAIAPAFRPTVSFPPGLEVNSTGSRESDLNTLFTSVDAVWLIAPEIDGCLQRLASRVTRCGTQLLGSDAPVIGLAADKSKLAENLERCGIPHPPTRVVSSVAQCRRAAQELGYPVVIKPVRGAGCVGVARVLCARDLEIALERVWAVEPRGRPLLLQRYIAGVSASVSLLADGKRAAALSVNRQIIRAADTFSYCGGVTPFYHRLAARAEANAIRACAAVPGLKGYIGVDLVLTRTEALVIEINPRLTTAYLGVRQALGTTGDEQSVVALALEACAGRLPAAPPAVRIVRFFSDGRSVVRRELSAVH